MFLWSWCHATEINWNWNKTTSRFWMYTICALELPNNPNKMITLGVSFYVHVSLRYPHAVKIHNDSTWNTFTHNHWFIEIKLHRHSTILLSNATLRTNLASCHHDNNIYYGCDLKTPHFQSQWREINFQWNGPMVVTLKDTSIDISGVIHTHW